MHYLQVLHIVALRPPQHGRHVRQIGERDVHLYLALSAVAVKGQDAGLFEAVERAFDGVAFSIVNGGGKVGHVGSLNVGLRLQVGPASALEQQDQSQTGSVPLAEGTWGATQRTG